MWHRFRSRLPVAVAIGLIPAVAGAQGALADYQRAEQLLPPAVDELVLNERVEAHWVGESDRFWYVRERTEGKEFLAVDAERATREPAFDHARLAGALAAAAGIPVDAGDLPFESFEIADEGARLGADALGAIELAVEEQRYRCELGDYTCRRIDDPEPSRFDRPSPDGKWVAFLGDHDLWVRSTATGERVRLSHDGQKDADYGASLLSPRDMVAAESQDVPVPVAAVWSPDSRRIASYRIDRRSAETFTVVQSTPESRLRPIAYTYHYALPGEVGLARAEPVIFDVYAGTRVAIDVEPVEMLHYTAAPRFEWSEDGSRLWFRRSRRGYGTAEIVAADPETGATRRLVQESLEPHINIWNQRSRVLSQGEEVLWSSERDGWNHLYLYDGATAQVTRRLTRGEWVVREIAHVDEEARLVYFTAGGREPGRDPYLLHLYRVGLDGGEITLLTPEAADHAVDVSPTGAFFVDRFSRVDAAPVTLLRRTSDGGIVMRLEEANLDRLLDTGWRWPERFRGVARDGETDIYGIIWRPSNLDPSRRYPVVEQIYTGPHGSFVPRTFGAFRNASQAIAELGFISVQIDGLGTNHRGKAFNDFSYRNLGDGGIPDHIALMRQMAERYPYMDLERVGIWGGSAGGYDSTRAILMYPDFYKVAVSTSGNHDHRMDKANWVEMWMGFPPDEHYVEQSNVTQAHRLQGELLLAHGELDDNVPLAATLRLVDALIEADKDFDLLIVPGRFHGLRGPYMTRRRWDFFVEHLLGVEPPEYRISVGREGDGSR